MKLKCNELEFQMQEAKKAYGTKSAVAFVR